MMNLMLQFEPNSKVTLLYANRSEERIIFQKELNQWVQAYPQFEYVDFSSGKKRIGKNDLIKSNNAQYYICGPDSLKDGIIHFLKELKISKSKINIEHYADGYTPWFGLLKRQRAPQVWWPV